MTYAHTSVLLAVLTLLTLLTGGMDGGRVGSHHSRIPVDWFVGKVSGRGMGWDGMGS